MGRRQSVATVVLLAILTTVHSHLAFTTPATEDNPPDAPAEAHRRPLILQPMQDAPFETPPAIQQEHEYLHEELAAAKQAGGKTAEAARGLERIMRDHFAEEEQYAMPPLGLLSQLAQGRMAAGASQAIAMAEHVRRNLPRFLEEHEHIKQALKRLAGAARMENKPQQAEFARRLMLHAEHEEQVLYPATILIGEHLKLIQPTAGPSHESHDAGPEIYVAALHPLNTSVNQRRSVSGAAVIVVSQGNLTVHVTADGLAPNMMHRQMIHIGGQCPTQAADENNDGIVDVLEGVPAYGLVLIPLDSDLSAPAEGEYSKADSRGRLHYSQTAPLARVEAAVTGEDRNPDDPIVTLKPGQPFSPEGKTVVLHGVSSEVKLPDSVQGVAGVEPYLTVPVACGVIERVTMNLK